MISCLQLGDGLIQYERRIHEFIDMKKLDEESTANGGVFVWCGGQVMTLIALMPQDSRLEILHHVLSNSKMELMK